MITFNVATDRKKVRVVLYRRKTSAPFYCRFWWKNKMYNVSTGQDTEHAAKNSARGQAERIIYATPLAADLTTLIDAYLLERWPEKVQKNNTAYLTQKSRMKLFKEQGPHDFATLPRRDASIAVQTYLTSRSKKKPFTIRSEQQAISRFCSWLTKTGRSHWESNPAQATYLDLPQASMHTKEALSESEVRRVLTAARGSELQPVVLLCLGAGCRPTEAVRAKWEDIDFKKKILKLFGKGRERRVHMSTWLVKMLLPLASKGAIWPGNYWTAFDVFGALRKKFKLPAHVSLQACRRTACRRAAEKISIFQYSEFFGHSLEVAKRHYIGWGLNVDRSKVNKALSYE